MNDWGEGVMDNAASFSSPESTGVILCLSFSFLQFEMSVEVQSL